MAQHPARQPLGRYLEAQDPVFDQVLQELRAAHKRTHWMWFIFPQIKGLGRSATADYFAIQSLDEAAAYADHPVLGPRLRLATELVNEAEGRSIQEILGSPDDLKFRSCMTLFARACRGEGRDASPFVRALDNTSPDSPIPCHSRGCRPEAERRDPPSARGGGLARSAQRRYSPLGGKSLEL
jgi:uncharacterized protein (DUF1810 family)